MHVEESHVLAEAIRRQRAEVGRLGNTLANATRSRDLANSAWIGAAEIDAESVPTDVQVDRIERDLTAARERLAELVEAEDQSIRDRIAAADAARAAHAQSVDVAERAVYQARLDADLAVVARLKAAEAGDLSAYIAHADASDAAQRRLASAKSRLEDLRSAEVA